MTIFASCVHSSNTSLCGGHRFGIGGVYKNSTAQMQNCTRWLGALVCLLCFSLNPTHIRYVHAGSDQNKNIPLCCVSRPIARKFQENSPEKKNVIGVRMRTTSCKISLTHPPPRAIHDFLYSRFFCRIAYCTLRLEYPSLQAQNHVLWF